MRFQVFLMATHLFLFIHDVLYSHIRQHEKMLRYTKKLLCQQKAIFDIEVNVAHQDYVSLKNTCFGNKKYYVTPKRRLMLTKYVA